MVDEAAEADRVTGTPMARAAARNSLVEEYQEYVHAVVLRMIRQMGLPAALFEEFVSAGYLGLVEAASRFDAESGAEFRNFAFLRIRGAVIDSIRECSELSGKGYRFARAIHSMHDLRAEKDRELIANSEIHRSDSAEREREEQQRLGRILDYLAAGALAFRLNSSFIDDDAVCISTMENPELLCARRQEQLRIRGIIAELPEKERLVIEKYYLEGRSFREISSEHSGMSKSWISRLHARALKRLRDRYLQITELGPADSQEAGR